MTTRRTTSGDRSACSIRARGCPPAERDRMERYDISIDELTVDHLVYSMGRQIENNFQSFYSVAEEVAGLETALAIAREIGRRYGGQGYAKLLVAQGRERRGRAADDGAVPGPRALDPRPQARGGAVCRVRRHPLHRAALAVHLLQRGAPGERRVHRGLRGRVLRGLRGGRRQPVCGSRSCAAGSRAPTAASSTGSSSRAPSASDRSTPPSVARPPPRSRAPTASETSSLYFSTRPLGVCGSPSSCS